jgi:TolA-binding protein
VKHYLGILFILILTACDGKQLNALQEKVNQLESLVVSVTEQQNTLIQKLTDLQTRLDTLKSENP